MANRLALLGLYKRVLRVHQQRLDPEMRQIGDTYIKNEFKAMKKAEKEIHVENFITEWKNYLQLLESQPVVTGKNIDISTRKRLNKDQKDNLKKLKKATKESTE